jgi:hypothetical protein
MNKPPTNLLWTFHDAGINRVKYARIQTLSADTLSLYRYDTTGRIVHYGPGGDVIEDDSTFQLKEVRIKKSTLPPLAPKKRTRYSL